MKKILDNGGRVLFSAPFIVYGILHFLHFEIMKENVPDFMFGIAGFLVAFTAVVLILCGISFLLAKYIKWTGIILGVLLFGIAIVVHLVNVVNGDYTSMSHLLKDLALSGGAFILASTDW